LSRFSKKKNILLKRRYAAIARSAVGCSRGIVRGAFPRHFGPPSLTEEGVDYFIGRTLDGALQSLLEQVRRELKLASGLPDNGSAQREEQASKITRAFAANLPKVRSLLESDILAAFQGDPAAQSIDEVLFCYPGVVAVTRHRLAHELYELGAPLLARIIAEIAHSDTGIDIHPGAICGRPPMASVFLALRTIWSAAVICPAYVCAEHMSAGLDEVRRPGSLSRSRALAHGA
jgi:hypothetical protein